MKAKLAILVISFLIGSVFQFGTPFLTQAAPLKAAEVKAYTCDGPCSPIHVFVDIKCKDGHCLKHHPRHKKKNACGITGDAHTQSCNHSAIKQDYQIQGDKSVQKQKNHYLSDQKDPKLILKTRKKE